MWKKIWVAIIAVLAATIGLIFISSDSGQAYLGNDGSLPYLSESRKDKIEKAWLKHSPEPAGWHIDHMRYYGTHEGYDIFLTVELLQFYPIKQ